MKNKKSNFFEIVSGEEDARLRWSNSVLIYLQVVIRDSVF